MKKNKPFFTHAIDTTTGKILSIEVVIMKILKEEEKENG